jgi:hypothetical protein
MRNRAEFLVALVLLSQLNACETTGDPRQGGLFGWSSSKADERQRELESEATNAQNVANVQQAQAQQTAARASALNSQVDDLHSQLNALLAENTRLTRQINDLTRKKKLAASDLDRVRRELNRNQQVRETASTQTSTSSRALVNQENQRLNDEVLFLLQK